MRTVLHNRNLGILFIRIGVGSVLFVHGIGKLLGIGPSAFPAAEFAMMLSGSGLPFAIGFAWLVTVVETVGGLALILGFLFRYFSILAALDMFAALMLVHLANGFDVLNGGYEFVLVMGLTALGLAFIGPGRYNIEDKYMGGEMTPLDYYR